MSPAEMGGLALSGTAWPAVDVDARMRELLFVVPLGSCEQHGPHLPFDVDSAVAQAVSAAFVHGEAGAVLGPTLAYGASGEHEGFPGTVSIGTETSAAVMVEIGRSALRWAGRVLFVTGHGGNADALTAACALLRTEGRDCAWWACGVRGGDAHAGVTETSLMLALRPGDVDLTAAEAGAMEPLAELLPAMRLGGVRAVSANGVLGDPAGASAERGRALLAQLVEQLQRSVAAWRHDRAGQVLSA